MECNKDEALRAKAIAEQKFEQKNYAGAKKFALKAQALYPGCDGLAQMLATLDVYISSENKISGEVDLYGVLGVSPSADDETVRKQYRKLALILHPDKNKSAGAEGAFKLLSEAWSILSDKSKRLAYNQRMGSKGLQQNVPPPPPRNGFHNASATSRAHSGSKATSRMPSSSSSQRSDTFWTICRRCKMHYEYQKIYLNHTLLCPNCHEAFRATETAPPFNHKSPSSFTHNKAPNGNPSATTAKTEAASFNNSNIRQEPFSRMHPSIAAKAASVVQQAQERMKRAREDAHASAGLGRAAHVFLQREKQRRVDEDGIRTATGYGERIYGFSSGSKYNSTRELTPLETRGMLIHKARKEIVKKLNQWKSEESVKAQDTTEHKMKGSKKEKQGIDNVNGNVEKKAVDASASDGDLVRATMDVPDPDFHNFDQDRVESCFGDNEVWAAYDDVDGMPRFYAFINKVISRKPFKVKLSWVSSKTNSEFGPMQWVASGFYKTCGEFRIGRYEISKSINSFSHKVQWSKGPRGSVQIYPKKGNVWALYRNWSFDWNENTPDDVIHKYDMFLMLDDFNEEQGISVAPLIQVAGFKTVFRPDLCPEKVKRISKEEMFRFSHQVPSHLLTGEEAQNAPKGCHELDPAATPVELLQTITETNEVQNGGDVKEKAETSEIADQSGKSREDCDDEKKGSSRKVALPQ